MTKTPTRPAAKAAPKAGGKAAGARASAKFADASPEAPAAGTGAGTEAPAEAPDSGATRTLRKKELVERVVAASGAKKKIAKDVVEATLQVLGEALAAGEQLVLPPFGNAHKTREKDTASGGSTMTLRLRRAGPKKPGTEGEESATEGLADLAE